MSQVTSEVRKGSGTSVIFTTTWNYTYDKNGNITQITDASNVVQYKYTYDDLGQLTREDNKALNKSYVWSYDRAGNITSKKTYAFTTGTLGTAVSTVNYSYGNASWGDLLTKYGSDSITYDTIGNPTEIGDYIELSWEGRRLTSYYNSDDDITIDYTYNADGIRTSQMINGVKHEYILNGSQIIAEKWDNKLLVYIYDEAGTPIGMKYRTNSYAKDVFDTYFFEKNLQGDIVAIYNASGTKLVSYAYDAWGNQSVTYSNGGVSTAAQYNPFRYRGYYYDTEIGWYYLQSRYYNPTWGRFINADGYINANGDIIGFNMFAYCSNNPIIYIDPNGKSILLFAAIGFGIGLFAGACFLPSTSEIRSDAENHYKRNQLNTPNESIESIMENYTKVEEWADKYHENTNGLQGSDAIYNDKYLSPDGGHYEIIICNPPSGSPYIVDEMIDPLNMGTYNYASNNALLPIYYLDHFFRDMLPYYAFGNTQDDQGGFLKWALN